MTDRCLDEQTALALATGRVAHGDRALALAHVDGCELCRELVAALVQLQQRAPLELPDETSGYVVGDRYQLITSLPSPTVGRLHEAHDLYLDRGVVLFGLHRGHLAHPSSVRRLRTAVAATRRLRHPGIARVHDLVETEDGWLLATEAVRGVPLDASSLAEGDLSDMMMRVATPLAHAHGEGVIHGDLVAANVLVDPGGHVTILGFGLAAATDGWREVTLADDVAAFGKLFMPAALGTPFGPVLERCAVAHVHAIADAKGLVEMLGSMAPRSPAILLSGASVDATGEIVDGRFRLDAHAGRGGMGTVYRATDLRTDTPAAVKLIEVQPERFNREVAALEKLSHPAVVRYIAHGRHGPVSFIAMEWLEGETLATVLERGAMDPASAIALIRTVAEAVGEGHQHGLVHRDLKPQNIMLSGGPKSARVFDFGLSRRAESVFRAGRPDNEITLAGAIVGTVGFMSPEQARGLEDVDARTDVFSLGCLLFECLTGRRAYDGEDPLAVIAKTVLADPPRLADAWPDAPDALSALLDGMLANDRMLRPPDGRAVARALDDIAATGDTMMLTTVARRITREERTTFTVLFVRPSRAEVGRVTALVHRVAFDFGADVHALLGGSIVLSWRADVVAEEHLRGVARAALTLAASPFDVALTLATGDAKQGAHGRVAGDVVERALALAVRDRARGIPIDAATAALMRVRFELVQDGDAWWLTGELPWTDRDGVRATFVGRDQELEALTAWAAVALHAGQPRAVILRGEAGIGKSRVCRELVAELRRTWPQSVVWTGACRAGQLGSAYAMIADALRTAAGIRSGESAQQWRDKLDLLIERSGVGDRTRALAFIGELVGMNGGEAAEGGLRVAREDATLMRDQIHQAWRDFVSSMALAGPVIITLEDIHWGDHPSLLLVDEVLRLSDVPVLVLATARDELNERFGSVWPEREVLDLPLEPLDRVAGEGLARATSPQALADEVVQRIVERSGGNPFYIEELALAAATGSAEIPGGVLAIVRGRLESMEPDARRVLRAASIFGGTAWAGGIRAVLGGGKGVDVDGWITSLVKRMVLDGHARTTIDLEREVSFRHALVRDAAYAMLTDADRTLGHRLAGRWLHKSGVRDPVLLAQHFELGGRRAKAARCWATATEAALSGNDVEGTVAHAARAVACGIDGHDKGVVLRQVAEAELFRGAFESAIRAGHEAMALLARGSEPWCDAAVQRAEALQVAGHRQELSELGRQLAHTQSPGGSSSLVQLARARVVFELRRAGLTEDAEALLASIDEVTSFTSSRRQAFMARFRAMEAHHHNGLEPQIRFLRDAVRLFLQCGDRRWAARDRRNLGFALALVGQFEDAQRELQGALHAVVQLGARPFIIGAMQQCLGLVRHRLGDPSGARQLEGLAIAACQDAGALRMEGFSRIYAAWACIAAGDLHEADVQAHAALQRFAESAPPVMALALAVRARVALTRGDVPVALRFAVDASAELAEAPSAGEGESYVLLVHAEALLHSGHRGRARTASLRAKDRILAHAGRLHDPNMRRCYLSRIPENVGILDLAAQLERG